MDKGGGELLPPFVLMAAGSPGFDAERCIEQEDALLGPVGKMTVIRRLDPEIVFQFDEDILETGRDFHARPHRKAKAVRLVRTVVRILAKDDHLDLVEGGVIERRKVFDAAWVDGFPRLDFFFQEFTQVVHIGLRKFREEPRFPRGLERSEEHTSELQSPDHLVCRLLLEKKKTPPRKWRNVAIPKYI